jgi:hypothetical protein
MFVTDPHTLVARSAAIGKPIVAVTLNYRLNMFAFGDGVGEPNLALRDQRSALEYIKLHIAGFGGDPVSVRQGRQNKPPFESPSIVLPNCSPQDLSAENSLLIRHILG